MGSFGARAGVLEIALADETRALATVRRASASGSPAWIAAMVVVELLSFVCAWWLIRIVLPTTRVLAS